MHILLNREHLSRTTSGTSHAGLLLIDLRGFNKKADSDPKSASSALNALVNDLESMNKEFYEIDMIIRDGFESSAEASPIYRTPGMGYYGVLTIAAEIVDNSRFPSEYNILSYAGL